VWQPVSASPNPFAEHTGPDPVPDPDLTARTCIHARLKADLVVLTGTRHRADLTMAVPLSASRLDRLEALCRHWGGPVSAAVYLALAPVPGAAASLDAAQCSLQALFDRSLFDTSGHTTAHCRCMAHVSAQPWRLCSCSCTLVDTANLREHSGRGVIRDADSCMYSEQGA